METVVSWTTTVVGSTLSPMAPYNIFQGFKLKLQGQYTPIEVESGSDAAFFQMYRPMRGTGQSALPTLLGSNTAGLVYSAAGTYTAPGYQNASGSAAAVSATAQVNQTAPFSVTNLPASGSNWSFNLEIPGGLFIDSYWDQAIDGTLLPNAQGRIAPMSAFVSPQYMGGGERVVVPTFNYAALNAASYDQGPLVGTTAGAASVTRPASWITCVPGIPSTHSTACPR